MYSRWSREGHFYVIVFATDNSNILETRYFELVHAIFAALRDHIENGSIIT